MIQIFQFPLNELVNDVEFQPARKNALLIAGKSLLTGFVKVPEVPRWHPTLSGNLNIYDWEMLMTGTVDSGEMCPLNSLQAGTVAPKDILRRFFHDGLKDYESGARRNGAYTEAVKIWPGTNEVWREYRVAIDRLSEHSSEETLTTVIVFSHGEGGSFQLGNSQIQYRRFLRDLDEIRGKKAIFMYACHSGFLLRALKVHERRRDYAVTTSCEAGNLSTNWGDRELDDYLWAHFSQGKTYSDLKLKPPELRVHKQFPQVLRYFDVRLI